MDHLNANDIYPKNTKQNVLLVFGGLKLIQYFKPYRLFFPCGDAPFDCPGLSRVHVFLVRYHCTHQTDNL